MVCLFIRSVHPGVFLPSATAANVVGQDKTIFNRTECIDHLNRDAWQLAIMDAH